MKTIEVDLFDSDSIDKAIIALNKAAKERERLIEQYVMELAQCGEVAAQKTYGSSVQVRAHKDDDGVWEIRANGEQVVFLEFGAGVKTKDHALSGPLPIDIEPGSWSEGPEGKHTWSKWLAENGGRYNDSPGYKEYRYNRVPRPGMLEAYKAIVANQERIAKKVFGESK